MHETELQMATKILGRSPTALEADIISALWSEHCSYKSSRKYLRKLPKAGERVLVGPGENAGVMDVGDGLCVAFKVESHNHPSFIEPFHGAATGMGGILRDIFAMGARPFAAMNLLRFGAQNHPRTPYLLNRVVEGISFYGNCFGVATVASDVDFDASYNGNILVNAFAIGVMPKDRIFHAVAKGVGNRLFYLGAKTGRDGIHGATMASKAFDDAALEQRPTVQVGDPFKEKLLLDACEACFEADVLVGLQDMGAAGLTCASYEMAARAGTGLILHLDRVPMREEKMTPRELMLSESQERMLMIAKPGKEKELVNLCNKFDLDCIDIGEVTGDGQVRLMWHGTEQSAMPAHAIIECAPQYDRAYTPPSPERGREIFAGKNQVLPQNRERAKIDHHWLHSQYDHHIGNNTLFSFDQAPAALVQIPGSKNAVALTIVADGRLCKSNPREGTKELVMQAASRLASVGAKPLGISDCLNFGSPEQPETMWEFVECIEGLAEAATTLGVPIVSGNVSFYNETNGRGIDPTPTIAMVGLVTNA